MLVCSTDAKSLDVETQTPTGTQPRLADHADALVEILRGYSLADLASLMKISDELAATNVERYATFGETTRPAIWAFTGDVFQGMEPRQWSDEDVAWAQRVLRIISGLYGVLRPLDEISAYRLEMGTKLATPRGKTLYEWWGSQITELLADDLESSPGSQVLVNLASKEYFSVLDPAVLGAPIISPRFEDTNARGKRSILAFYAKRARGAMASWIVRNRIDDPARLREFTEFGYRYDPDASSDDVPVFYRSFEDR